MRKSKLPDLSRLFDSRKFNVVFSLIVAVICWAFVVTTVETNYDGIIEDVPVNFSSGMATISSQGLSILGTPEAVIDIAVTGDRALVGALRASDFNVVVRYDSVTGPGTYSVPIVATKADNYADFSILSITPLTVDIRVDRIETISIPVTVDIRDIVIEDGYIAGTPSATPAEITVQGSASEIERIASAVVKYEGTAPLSERAVSSGEILLYDSEGGEIITTGITMDTTEADISIPVLKMGTMQTKFEYVNAPSGFDTDTLKYTIEPSVISISGAEADIDRAGDLLLGYIDLASFEMNASYEFEVVLPSGFTNLDNVTTARISFDTTNLSEKTITVEDFRIKNPVQNLDIEIASLQIQSVTLIGETETLETLLSDAVIGEIDMADINVAQGLQEVPVQIQIPSMDNVFAVGEHTVVIEVS